MISFDDVTVTFKHNNTEIRVADKFNATIHKNDFTCVLGPSGCGKTTLLNLIAGFQAITKGTILIDNSLTSNSKLKLSYVFQEHNIFPWKTVRQNIAFGLSTEKLDALERDRRVKKKSQKTWGYQTISIPTRKR